MNTLSWIVDGSFSARLTVALLHFLWQGCIGGLIVIAGGWLLRDASSRTRYLLNVATMLLMAVCLPVTFLLLDSPEATSDRSGLVETEPLPALVQSNVEPADASRQPTAPSNPDVTRSAGPVSKPDATVAPRPNPVEITSNPVIQTPPFTSLSSILSSSAFTTLARWIALLYLTGVALVLGRLMRGVWGGDRLRKLATTVNDLTLLEMVRQQAQLLGLKVVPTIAWCEQISVPVVVGIIRPMILLPVAVASGLTPSQLQALLLHELSHIRRFDPIVNLLQRIVEAALFFHPVVWFVSRRISIERELAADDMVLAAGWDRPLYADALVRVAELASSLTGSDAARRATVLGASGTNPSEFKARVLRLLNEAPPPKLDLSRVGIASTLLLLVVGGTIAWSQTDKPERATIPSRPVEDDSAIIQPNEDEILISGRVIDAAGEPVAKAIVAYPFVYVAGRPRSATGESDQTGAFRLVIKQSDIPRGTSLALFHATIWAWAEGHAIGAAHVEGVWDLTAETLQSSKKPITIQLRKQTPSTYTIKTEAGKPLVGATVVPSLVRVPNGDDPLDGYFGLFSPLPDALLKLASRSTDADGRVVIDTVPPQYLDRLEVASESHGRQLVRLTKGGADEEFTMLATGSLKGRLVGGPPELMRGVLLFLSTPERYAVEGTAIVTTDQDGSFEVPAMANGRLQVSSNLDLKQPWKLAYKSRIGIEPGRQTELVLNVEKGIPVTGRLVVRGTDTPVVKADISISSGSFTNYDRRKTDEQGEFQTFIVPGNDMVIQVIGLLGSRDLTFPAMTQTKVTIPENADSFRVPNIEIPKSKTWAGRLVDQSDRPLAGVYVQAFDHLTQLDHPARTDAAGAFKLTLRDDQIPSRWSVAIKWEKRPLGAEDYLPAEVASEDPFVLRVKVRDKTTTFKKPPLLLPDHWIVNAVGFDNSSKELVTASIQGGTTIRRWDVVGKQLISEIKLEGDKHGRGLREQTLTLSRDCQKVIAATDAYVGIWDTSTGKLLNKLPIPKIGDADTIGMLTCTPDLSVIAGNLTTQFSRLTLRYDAHTVVWNAVSDKAFRVLNHKGQNELIAMSLSADGKRLATTNGSGAFIWDTTTGQELLAIKNDNTGRRDPDPAVNNQFNNNVWSIQFSPDAKVLAMGDTFGVKLLDSTSGNILRQLEGPYRYSSGHSPGLVFSKDGQMVARLGTGHKPEQATSPDVRVPPLMTPLITTVGTAGSTQYVIPIWSTQTGQMLFEIHAKSNDAAFSNDGRQLAVVCSDLQQALSVWNLNRGGSDPDQTEGPGPEPRQDKVEQNGHYRGATAAEFIDQFKPTWSDAKLGIQYGIALTKPQHQFRVGERVPLVAFLRNASDQPLKVDSYPDYLGNSPKIMGTKGTAIELENIPLVGYIPHYVETLQPGESVGPFYFSVGLGENPRPGKQHWHPLVKAPKPGAYKLTHTITINVGGPERSAVSTPGDIISGQIEFEILEGAPAQN